jgi:hypothetical protein
MSENENEINPVENDPGLDEADQAPEEQTAIEPEADQPVEMKADDPELEKKVAEVAKEDPTVSEETSLAGMINGLSSNRKLELYGRLKGRLSQNLPVATALHLIGSDIQEYLED